MSKKQKVSIFLLRVALGCLFLYAGVTKIIDPTWTAAGFLQTAKTLPELYAWFALPANIVWVNILNKWGLTLIGVSLISGWKINWSAPLAVILMVLYYLPGLSFPYAGEHSFIVDEHIVYILALAVLVFFRASYFWGIDGRSR